MKHKVPIKDIIHLVPSVSIDKIEYNDREGYYYEKDRLIEFGDFAVNCDIYTLPKGEDMEAWVEGMTFYAFQDEIGLTEEEEELLGNHIETLIIVE